MRTRGLQRQPAGEAQLLEEGELGLDSDAGRTGGVDERERVGEDRGRRLEPPHFRRRCGDRRFALRARDLDGGGTLGLRQSMGERRARLGRARHRVGPQPARLRIDAEDDLGLAGRHRGREPVAEEGRARWAPVLMGAGGPPPAPRSPWRVGPAT